MAEAPRPQYAQSDGLHVAYQVLGQGPPDMLFLSGVIPVDMFDEQPSIARFRRRLATFCRFVRFNPRGLGLSDPVSPANPLTLEQHVRDGLAVMDAVGVTRGAVFGSGLSALPAITFAATCAERVSHLIVVNGTARPMSAADYPIGMSRDRADAEIVLLESDAVDRGFDLVAWLDPDVADDAMYRAWWDRAGNRGASPAVARAYLDLHLGADVRQLLGSIRAPTLILHRRDINPTTPFPVDAGRYLAEHISGASYVELNGANASYWIGDTDVMLDEIEEFLTGVRRRSEPDRALAAVLFTDIVDSTARIAGIGERSWRDLLDRHDAMLRRELGRFGGREIKHTGDGMLAMFDRPAPAVQCACSIRDAAAELGIEVRAGVHFGEVEVRADDLAGMAVHIAARINAFADPGEVLVSRTIVDIMAGSEISFTDRGEHPLKGAPGRWALYAVTT